MTNSPKNLIVIDFDGTLFRSPERPEGWRGAWWGSPWSLKGSFVTDDYLADDKNWNLDLLRFLQNSDPQTEVIILTGRLKKVEEVVRNCLNSRLSGIDYNLICSPGDEDTLTWKLGMINSYISSHTYSSPYYQITLFEDRHYSEFREAFPEFDFVTNVSVIVYQCSFNEEGGVSVLYNPGG